MAEADLEDLHFAVHHFRVGRPNRSDLELSNADGIDIYPILMEGLCNKVAQNVQRRSYTKIFKGFSDDKARYITGYIEGGLYGEEKSIVDINPEAGEANPTTSKVGKRQSAPDLYFFSLYVPSTGKFGFFMLQQRGVRANAEFFAAVLKKILSDVSLNIRVERVGPADLAKLIEEAELSRMTFVSYGIPKWASMEMEGIGNKDEIGKVTLIVEAKPKGALNSYKAFAQKLRNKAAEGYKATEATEYDPARSKFTFKMGDRQYTASTDVGAMGRPTWTNKFDTADPESLFRDMASYSKYVFEGLLNVKEKS